MLSDYFSICVWLSSATLRGIIDLGTWEGGALCGGPCLSLGGAWDGTRAWEPTEDCPRASWLFVHPFTNIQRHSPFAWGTAWEFCPWPWAAASLATSEKSENRRNCPFTGCECGELAPRLGGISSHSRAFDRREASPPSTHALPPSASLLGKGWGSFESFCPDVISRLVTREWAIWIFGVFRVLCNKPVLLALFFSKRYLEWSRKPWARMSTAELLRPG